MNVTVKLSKPSEIHPGTCDRVALLIGERAGVAQAAHDIVLMLETVSIGWQYHDLYYVRSQQRARLCALQGQDNYGSSERRMLPGDAIVCLRTLLPAAAGKSVVVW